MKEIVDLAIYAKSMKGHGINYEAMPISRLKRETVVKCKELLDTLSDLLIKSDAEKTKGQEADAVFLEEACEKIYELSGQYYELLPQSKYLRYKPSSLDTRESLKSQYTILEDLMNIETASKIILAAQGKSKEMHPLDYCYKALDISLEPLEPLSDEYEMLKKYINQSKNKSYLNTTWKIESIFRLKRKGEDETFKQFLNMDNGFLLYHGTKTCNLIGILSQGLCIAPTNVAITGWAFGKGSYFADMLCKSVSYCSSQYLFMFVCEVALGKMHNLVYANFTLQETPSGYDNVKALGNNSPDLSMMGYRFL
jgi:poly [ADP-ribose] polymerase